MLKEHTNRVSVRAAFDNWLTIKRMVKIYLVFIFALILSIILLNNLNKKYVQNILISNTESQLGLMNDSLRDDLYSAQISLIDTMKSDKFSGFLNVNSNNEFVIDDQSNEVKKQLKEIMNYINLFGSLDVYTPIDKKIITTRFEENDDSDTLGKFYANITTPGWYQIPNKGLYYVELYPTRSDREVRPVNYLVAGKIKNDYFPNFISNFNSDPNVKYFFEFLKSNSVSISSKTKLEKILASKIKSSDLQRNNIEKLQYSYKSQKYTALSVYNTRSDGILTAYFNQSLINNYYQPVSKYFTAILILLLVVAITVSMLFYLKVYKNIGILTQYFRRIEKGEMSARITGTHTSSEFNYVFLNFNSMMNQIESLMKTTKNEIRLREHAELRQLQAQINPHFLYNSLFFIMSMAQTSPKAVISMSENLAEYYRYTTKNFESVSVSQEIAFVNNYLKIMSLRKKITFSITVPSKIMDNIIPPLIIQPLVENAIYHGIEGRSGASKINISGSIIDGGYLISVSDDGKGMTNEEIIYLLKKLKLTHRSNSESVGLWNLDHRLVNLYGIKSGLRIFRNRPGLTVSFWIPFNTRKEDDD